MSTDAQDTTLKKILKNTTKVYRRVVFLRTFLYFMENPPKYIKCTELYNSCTANTRVVLRKYNYCLQKYKKCIKNTKMYKKTTIYNNCIKNNDDI